MKKLFTLLCLLVVFGTGFAQLRVALLAGPHAASVDEKNSIPGWETQVKPFYGNRSGFNIGFLADIPLNNSGKLYFQPGIFYLSKGRKFQRFYDTTQIQTDTLSVKHTFYTNYIDIPLNVTYKMPLGKKAKFFVSAGPYLSFFYNGKNSQETLVAIGDSALKFNKEEDDIEVGKASRKAKTFDYGINGRAGFELGGVIISGFISQGLGNFFQTDDDANTFKHKVFGASVGFWLNKAAPTAPKKPKDQDNDGIPDVQDGCPTQPGSALTNGCPDKDGDGIADNVDKCPDVAGKLAYKGCPIPDTDKDGVNDEEDKCPTEAGPASNNGCPLPRPEPDTDGDGVIDKEDKCPTEPGTRANNGCPVVPVIEQAVIEKVNYAARNIFFPKGSDKLATTSYPALDEVANILQKNATLRLNINGYTDNSGAVAANKLLSQKRADAVKKYLSDKGIAASRLTATGHGPANPVADNSTEAGRNKNRRVELKLMEQ
ncbi:MAG: OmpA family protein [Niastella sp.]|nr:OmpA family protein [Niastella sp.]